jgi:hypothetical protein
VPVNSDKPRLWKDDVARSVDLFNSWFVEFAPAAYRDSRAKTTGHVEEALRQTADLADISPEKLRDHPAILPVLRMACCPPLARDRLIGLAGANKSLVGNLENGRLPPRMSPSDLSGNLACISGVLSRMLDRDIFPWLAMKKRPSDAERLRAATIVADRLCGAIADPIIRNAQEQRQLAAIGAWLNARGYRRVDSTERVSLNALPPATYAFRLNVPVKLERRDKQVNIPIDVAVKPKTGKLPLLIEAKSAGDFTNTNKRRKEEAAKMTQLRSAYGRNVRFILFLCGYFDSGYLGYEAAEGIDWVWEHRIEDLAKFGV